MKATDLLKMQHREVEALFSRFEKADRAGDKRQIFEQLAANLVAHDAIEREIFYPACETRMGMTDLLAEALVEHGLVEFSVYRADQNLGDDSLEHHVTVLKEVVEHHVKEEEKELFPQVMKAFDGEDLEELGLEMEARFEQALASDFRAALVDNLRQVLAGAMKTAPKKAASKAGTAKRASATKRSGAKRKPAMRKSAAKASAAPKRVPSNGKRKSASGNGARKASGKRSGSASA